MLDKREDNEFKLWTFVPPIGEAAKKEERDIYNQKLHEIRLQHKFKSIDKSDNVNQRANNALKRTHSNQPSDGTNEDKPSVQIENYDFYMFHLDSTKKPPSNFQKQAKQLKAAKSQG